LCTPEKDRQAMKQAAFEVSKKNILVVDASKFYSSSLYKILKLNDFDVVISDLEPKNLDQYDMKNTQYVYALCDREEVEEKND
jgi:DeoR/GlpR family transcriptional regulator of sugar metabolism